MELDVLQHDDLVWAPVDEKIVQVAVICSYLMHSFYTSVSSWCFQHLHA